MSFAAPMERCCLVLVLVVLRVLDAIEAFKHRWLSGTPNEGVGPGGGFDYVVWSLIWLEGHFKYAFKVLKEHVYDFERKKRNVISKAFISLTAC